jgi:hypothetical protein
MVPAPQALRSFGYSRVRHGHRIDECIVRVGDAAGLAAFAQAQTVHDTAGVIGIVAHAEFGKNGVGEACGGPTVGFETRCPRPGLVDPGDGRELVRSKAAGTAGRPAFPQGLDTYPV